METTPIWPFQVARDGDRHAAHRKVGIGTLFFKVTTVDSNGAFLVVEIAHHAKGGPPRHPHRDQDEWLRSTPRTKRISGPEKIRSSPEKDFFSTICQLQTWAARARRAR
jgi:hypothetical protein